MITLKLHQVCLNRRGGRYSCRGIPHSPNSIFKMHWGERSRWKKAWEEEVHYAILELKSPIMIKKKPTVAVTLHARELQDRDNAMASLKPIFDGLVKSGLLEDDSAKHCTILAPKMKKVEHEKDECVIIKIS